MGRHCSNTWAKRATYGDLQFCNFCCKFTLFHCQEHYIQGNNSLHLLLLLLLFLSVWLSLHMQAMWNRTQHQCHRREQLGSKQWHSEYQQIQQLSWGVDSWEVRTLFMIIWAGITTRIVTLKVLLISSLETACPYLRSALFPTLCLFPACIKW